MAAELSFTISSEEYKAFQEHATKQDMHLRVCCVQAGDATAKRFHWPLYANLHINEVGFGSVN